MGFTREEMEKKIPDIIEFADIGDFIYQPVKTYSSGMYVRLAFAIAIHVDPDILIIDEALSVGDIRFQRKCFRKIEEFKKTKTFILVSHDLSSITKFCDRAIWLNEGVMQSEGNPAEIAKEFRAYMIDAKFTSKADRGQMEKKTIGVELEAIPKDVDMMGDDKAEFLGLLCMDAEGNKISVADANSKIQLLFQAHIKEELTDAIVGFTFKDKLGTIIFQLNTFVMNKELHLEANKTYLFEFVFTLPKLVDGYYTISPAIASGSQAYHIQHCWIFDAMVIQVLNKRDINLEGYNYIDDAEFYMEMQEEERRYEQMLRNSYYSYEEEDVFNVLYLVDGDNHVYEGLEGIDNIGTFGKVIVFVSQEGLKDNLAKRYGGKIDIVMVRPGENAVDNRIKGILGNKIRQRKSYQKIYVISHDNGYRNLVDKYQRKYNLSAGYLSLKKAIKYC